MYSRVDGVWTLTSRLLPEDAEAFVGFGGEVAIFKSRLAVSSFSRPAPGESVVVPGPGAVHVFEYDGSTFRGLGVIENTIDSGYHGTGLAVFGELVAIGTLEPVEGSIAPRGALGVVWLYGHHDGSWLRERWVQPANTDPGDQFGASLALSESTLAVGAKREASSATGIDGDGEDDSMSQSGAVYTFELTQ